MGLRTRPNAKLPPRLLLTLDRLRTPIHTIEFWFEPDWARARLNTRTGVSMLGPGCPGLAYGTHIVREEMIMRDIAYALGRVMLSAFVALPGTVGLVNVIRAVVENAPQWFQGPQSTTYMIGTAAMILLLVIGGMSAIMVAIGYRARWAAVTLMVFAVLNMIHTVDPAIAGAVQITFSRNVLLNISLLGALLRLAASGPGRYSIDGLRAVRQPTLTVAAEPAQFRNAG